MLNIFITHVSYHFAPSLIKLLREIEEQEIRIVGCSSLPLGESSGSMLVDRFYQAPRSKNEKEYIDFLKEICKKEAIHILFSADEDVLRVLSKRKNEFNSLIITPETEIFQTFCDKYIACNAINELGILTPKMITSKTEIDIYDKIIIRERVSCGSLGIKIIEKEDFHKIKTYFSDKFFIQEFINGREYTVDIFSDRSGMPKLIVPRERVAIRSGISYKCKIEYNTKLIELSKMICNKYKMPAFSNIQFIIDDKTGDIYFIEVNPRIGATSIATSLVSINLAKLFVSHFYYKKKLNSFEYYMKQVKWGAFISRYYETIVHFPCV